MKSRYLLITSTILFLSLVFFLFLNSSPQQEATQVLFTVPRGKSLSYVAQKLKQENLIRSSDFFLVLAKLFYFHSNIKAGVYEIQTLMTSLEILDLLVSGKVKMIQFTIIEGWTNEQIAEYFLEQNYIQTKEEFLSLTKDPEILKKYNIYGPTTEGFLFPETYTIDPQLPIKTIHEIMIKFFFKKLSEIADYQKLTPKELYEKIIIASIIEREAVHKEELSLMASVYYNRLKKKMKLQADPTIQYILKDPKKKLTLKDLEIDSPYNTYKYKGLPPTPISNPGFFALKAAFYPAETDYLFFVRIEGGRHHFSKTYSEHVKAKREYWDKQ
ncbi:MAG: endolytic transglycosylase MltG [Leptospiraceae bacterium]|nr:endolytic transglycosylase MltG [Leptospiraceae bacterium]MDW7976975.1 endolytic transglycosylase MltG [Leptospiraceae bacterium]